MAVTVNVGLGAGTVAPSEYNNGNSGTSLAINFNNGLVQKVTMTGNCTFTFNNPVVGEVYALKLLQDATGSRTATWPAAVTWPAAAAPTLSGANKTDIVTFYWDGTKYYATSSLNYT